MTTREKLNLINKTGTLRVEKLQVAVTILDARTCWGRDDLLVAPILGEGQQWVEASRIKIASTPGKEVAG